jgi:hypothetical protein
LGEAQRKVFQFGHISAQRPGQAAKVGHHLCNNFDIRVLAAVGGDGISKGSSSFLAAFNALLDPLVAELFPH